jgi:hypothetical protein
VPLLIRQPIIWLATATEALQPELRNSLGKPLPMNRQQRPGLLDRLSRQLFTGLNCYRNEPIVLLARVVGHYL